MIPITVDTDLFKMASLCIDSVRTAACLVLLSCGLFVTSAPVLEDEEELTQMVGKVYNPEFSSLQMVVRRVSAVPIENAAAMAVATDCSENFSNQHSLQSRFDRLFKTSFEDRCAEVLPVFDKYKEQIEEIVKERGNHQEILLKKMGLACREIIKGRKKSEIYEIFLSYVKGENFVNNADTCCEASQGSSRRKLCLAGKFEIEFDEDQALEAMRDEKSLFSSIAPSEYSDKYSPTGSRRGAKKKEE